MSRLVSVLRAIARHEVERRSFCELGEVTSVFDSDDGDDVQSVSVKLKDTGLPLARLPVATGVSGVGALPRVGDLVLVLFPRGDLASAIVAGQVYSDQRRPPSFKKDRLALVWPGDAADADGDAVAVTVDTGSGGRALAVALGGDKDARLDLKDGAVTLTAGGVTLSLHHNADSDGVAEITAGGTKITVKQDGDLTIESAGTLKLKGQSISLEGDVSVKINGQSVEIN